MASQPQVAKPDPALDSAEGAAGDTPARVAGRHVGMRRFYDVRASVIALLIAFGAVLGIAAYSALADVCGR